MIFPPQNTTHAIDVAKLLNLNNSLEKERNRLLKQIINSSRFDELSCENKRVLSFYRFLYCFVVWVGETFWF